MVTLEKVDACLFPKLYQAFLHDDDPLSNEQDWRNVFAYDLGNEEDYCGYAMLADGVVIGMIGMIFSTRDIAGTPEKFCNLHTWWVREDQRGRSLTLLKPLLGLKGYTITHFTPCDRVRAVCRRMGFHDLKIQLRLLFPLRLGRGNPWGRDLSFNFEAPAFVDRLSETEQKICRDHQPYHLGHLHVRSPNDSCYILYAHVVRHSLGPYCHIHYISNRDFFQQHERAVRTELINRHRVRFAAIDTRLSREMRLARSMKFWSPAQGLVKTSTVAPESIDYLYSDVTFLRLTVLPHMRHELSKRLRLTRGA